MFLSRLNSSERSAFVATAMHFVELAGPMKPAVASRLAYVAREANIKLDGTLSYDSGATLDALETRSSCGVFILELITLSYLAHLRDSVHIDFIKNIETRLGIDPDIANNIDLWAQQYKSNWKAASLMIDVLSKPESEIENAFEDADGAFDQSEIYEGQGEAVQDNDLTWDESDISSHQGAPNEKAFDNEAEPLEISLEDELKTLESLQFSEDESDAEQVLISQEDLPNEGIQDQDIEEGEAFLGESAESDVALDSDFVDQEVIQDSPLDAPANAQTYLKDPTLAAIEDEPLGLLLEDDLILSRT